MSAADMNHVKWQANAQVETMNETKEGVARATEVGRSSTKVQRIIGPQKGSGRPKCHRLTVVGIEFPEPQATRRFDETRHLNQRPGRR